jgi:hypothetical protein
MVYLLSEYKRIKALDKQLPALLASVRFLPARPAFGQVRGRRVALPLAVM